MRPIPLLLMAFAVALATGASACPVLIPSGPRNAASIEYDQQYCAWRRALGERIATDPDPDVAWAGAAIAVADGCDTKASLPFIPSPPTTAGGRQLHFRHCLTSGTCSDALAQWRAAEPDNLYVMGLALDAGENVAAADFERATHYADGWLDLRRIVATTAARYDLTPPPKPQDYEPRRLWVPSADRPTDLVFPTRDLRLSSSGIQDHAALDHTLRLKLADLLIDAEGSPFAAELGANIGIEIAVGPVERRRYCTASQRLYQNAAALWQLTMQDPDASLSRQFAESTRGRNLLDALDAISASLPADLRAGPTDEREVQQCIDRVQGDEDDESEDSDAADDAEADEALLAVDEAG